MKFTPSQLAVLVVVDPDVHEDGRGFFMEASHERTLRWDDEDVAFEWPLPESEHPLLSAKGAAGASLKDADAHA